MNLVPCFVSYKCWIAQTVDGYQERRGDCGEEIVGPQKGLWKYTAFVAFKYGSRRLLCRNTYVFCESGSLSFLLILSCSAWITSCGTISSKIEKLHLSGDDKGVGMDPNPLLMSSSVWVHYVFTLVPSYLQMLVALATKSLFLTHSLCPGLMKGRIWGRKVCSWSWAQSLRHLLSEILLISKDALVAQVKL